jgi:hypothetical protein
MRFNARHGRCLLTAAVFVFSTGLWAQQAPTPPAPQPNAPQPQNAQSPANGQQPGAAAARPPAGGPKKYSDVITAKAKTKDGLFKVHQVEEKYYYEIPESLLGRDMLMYNEIAQAPPGVGYSGNPGNFRMVRWSRRNNKVLLRVNPATKRATDGDEGTQLAVELSNFEPIIRSFNVEAEGPEGTKSVVIDVTPMFTADIPEFSAVGLLASLRLPAAPPLDASRCFIEEIKSFPENIEVRTTLTWNLGTPPLPPTTPNAPPRPVVPNNLRSLSVMVHYSMVLLPETPMQGRYFDPRVGYFTQNFEEYANEENRVERKAFIARYRLEKKDPNAAVSEPVKPIVYYVSREVPAVWRPYVQQGIEDWNVAFEHAGFRNAIVGKMAPTKEEDPNWDPEDVRYSVIRWAALPTQNAMGPHVHDPRSGEIISAHVIMWHDVLKLAQRWYFSMASAQDDAARKLPFEPKLMGELLRYVVAHEVGHAIGLRHNHKASSAYSIAQLRDPKFTKEHGSVASIMAYGRFNYVAQPEDGVTALSPIIAPYDKFAIEWGYKPFPGVKKPEDEKKFLDEIAARQLQNPFLQFGGEDGPSTVDPTVKTENIGDDPIEATRLGIKNMDRIVDGWLISATTRPGEKFDVLEETYEGLWGLRRTWLGSVVKMVGGVVETRSLAGRGGEQFARVPKERQKQAVAFLHEHAFTPAANWMKPEIVNQFKYMGASDLIMSHQKQLLESLLTPMRFKLLTDAEAMDGAKAYSLRDFLSDVQSGIFREAARPGASVDVYRRALQRNYVEHMRGLLNRPATGASANSGTMQQTDFRAAARGLLGQLNTRLLAARTAARDEATRNHFDDLRKEIEMILDPKKG